MGDDAPASSRSPATAGTTNAGRDRRPRRHRGGLRRARDLVPRGRRLRRRRAPAPRRSDLASTAIERADSFIVDPHKWLFAPYDCCALRLPGRRGDRAARSSRRRATSTALEARGRGDRPADLAYHLSRRTRGLPVLVLARDVRNGRLPGRRRGGAHAHPSGGARRSRRHPQLELIDGAGPVRDAVPAARMGPTRLRSVVAAPARGPGRVRPADDVVRREGRAPVLREPRTTDRPRPAVLGTMA